MDQIIKAVNGYVTFNRSPSNNVMLTFDDTQAARFTSRKAALKFIRENHLPQKYRHNVINYETPVLVHVHLSTITSNIIKRAILKSTSGSARISYRRGSLGLIKLHTRKKDLFVYYPIANCETSFLVPHQHSESLKSTILEIDALNPLVGAF